MASLRGVLFQTVGGTGGGMKQSTVTPLAGERWRAVLWERNKGFTKECPHRHMSWDRAVACAKDLLARNSVLRVERTL